MGIVSFRNHTVLETEHCEARVNKFTSRVTMLGCGACYYSSLNTLESLHVIFKCLCSRFKIPGEDSLRVGVKVLTNLAHTP